MGCRVWPWVSFVLSAVFVLWTIKSIVVYHTWTPEDVLEDASVPLPLNEAGFEWFGNMVGAYFGAKQSAIRVHTIVTAFIGVSLFFQMWKRSRGWGGAGKPFHVWLGRIVIVAAVAALPHFASLIAGMDNVVAQ